MVTIQWLCICSIQPGSSSALLNTNAWGKHRSSGSARSGGETSTRSDDEPFSQIGINPSTYIEINSYDLKIWIPPDGLFTLSVEATLEGPLSYSDQARCAAFDAVGKRTILV